MAEWPTSLPDEFLLDGYSGSMPDNVIRQDMSVGPPKQRRRSTAAVEPITGRIVLDDNDSPSQLVTFNAFYRTTLSDGAVSFTWTHPETGSSADFIFTSPPVKTPAGAGYWFVDMSLAVLP